jgi:hypothetical protein
LASCPSRRCRIWRPVLAYGSGDGWLVVLLVRCSCGGALGPCWREVQRGLGCVASSWCVWCSGDLGFSWAEVWLSEQSQVYESLAEECEAVGEARPPRRVCGQARWFFFGTSMRVFCRSIVGAEGSTIMCERLAGDSSRWRSSGGCWSLQRVAASGVALRW